MIEIMFQSIEIGPPSFDSAVQVPEVIIVACAFDDGGYHRFEVFLPIGKLLL